ncbi:MAG: Two-component system sensor histidine kinase [Ktedonobacterales bacterium]|jgi:two-component system NarL family sensor kinase|nr:MAG: Two-component system sensor histidine kinase [Ktedonobacterales bacterium]
MRVGDNKSDTQRLGSLNRELSILNIIAQALNRSVEMGEALQAALAQVAELLGLETGWIWLLDEETGQSYLGAAQNLPKALTKNPRRMTGSCYCLDTYREGDLAGAANVNVVKCSRLSGLVDDTNGLRYHASIPLYAHGKKLGVLNVASADWRELSADDLRLLYTVGDMLGIAIERARLFAQSARLGAFEERSRLARELHDTIAQGLAGVSLQLETADALLDAESDPQRVQRIVRQALALTRANLEETRRSVHDLRAAPLEGRTLPEALRELACQWTAQGNPPVRVETIGESRPLPVRIENGLYRMAQEALTNVSHHADATTVTLRLESVPERIRLLVEDNGRGFDTNEPRNGGRYGLIGLNERAKLLGGTLRLESSPGAGTRLEIGIPLTEKK